MIVHLPAPPDLKASSAGRCLILAIMASVWMLEFRTKASNILRKMVSNLRTWQVRWGAIACHGKHKAHVTLPHALPGQDLPAPRQVQHRPFVCVMGHMGPKPGSLQASPGSSRANVGNLEPPAGSTQRPFLQIGGLKLLGHAPGGKQKKIDLVPGLLCS